MKKTYFTLTAFLLFSLVPLLTAQPFPYQESTLPIDQRIPINFSDENYHLLYTYGFGITSMDDFPPGSSPQCLSAIITSMRDILS